MSREIAIEKASDAVVSLKGVPSTDAGRQAREAMALRGDKSRDAAFSIIKEAVQKARVVQAGGTLVPGAPSDAVKAAAANSLIRLYPQFSEADHSGWPKVLDRARKKDPDAIKAVDHIGSPETHPVCKAILTYLGPGRKGSDIRSNFGGKPYGWPQDAIDGALTALANAGQVRVLGEDSKPASLPDLARAKIGVCTFRSESTVITLPQRLAVRGLLNDADVKFEKEQEAFVLGTLLDKLETSAQEAGGAAPAPISAVVPDLAVLRTLSGNDLLAELAKRATNLKALLKEWKQVAQTVKGRLPRWRLAERLVAARATDQLSALEAVKASRSLTADPDPVPPIIAAATDSLRTRINTVFTDWETAWNKGEARLAADSTWGRLSPELKHRIRQDNSLLQMTKPAVESPEAVADSLEKRSLSQWSDMVKAFPTRIEDALAHAAAELEPKAHSVQLPSGLLKTEAELDSWLAEVRKRIAPALSVGPVIPKV